MSGAAPQLKDEVALPPPSLLDGLGRTFKGGMKRLTRSLQGTHTEVVIAGAAAGLVSRYSHQIFYGQFSADTRPASLSHHSM